MAMSLLGLHEGLGSHMVRLLLGIGLFSALLMISFQRLPVVWSNLGMVSRNHALLAEYAPTTTRSDELAQAHKLLDHSNAAKSIACNPVGFYAQFLVACTDVTQWEKAVVTGTTGLAQTVYLASSPLDFIGHRQALTLLLPQAGFSNVDSLTLLTFTGHSTRMQQGDKAGYALVVAADQKIYVTPLRSGIETGESMYDSPDVPPQHEKPAMAFQRGDGGLAYPLEIRFAHSITPVSVTVWFTYAQYWHVDPVLAIWAISVEDNKP
jgi:hypothetical protein